MVRSELTALQEQVQASLKIQGITAAAVSGKNVINQDITVIYEDERYSVPVHVFALHDIEHIAKRIKEAHGIAQK